MNNYMGETPFEKLPVDGPGKKVQTPFKKYLIPKYTVSKSLTLACSILHTFPHIT
jgi:hypothetical protein